jgi:hypothetical protein
MGVGASVATFHLVRRRRRSTTPEDEDQSPAMATTSPMESVQPLEEETTNGHVASEHMGKVATNPQELESSPQSPTTSVAEPTESDSSSLKNSASYTSQESNKAGVLEHDPAIELEIHQHLDMAKEWIVLRQSASNTAYPLQDPKFIEARRQPKSLQDKQRLAVKYGSIKDISERAYQVLLDLGMIEESKPVDMSKFDDIIDTTT